MAAILSRPQGVKELAKLSETPLRALQGFVSVFLH